MEGIQRLANLLQQLAQNRTGNTAAVRASSIEQLGAFLQWLVSEAATLSPDARTEAFWWVSHLCSKPAICIWSLGCVALQLGMVHDVAPPCQEQRNRPLRSRVVHFSKAVK